MKKTICCRFDVAPVIRKLVEFAGLFSYDRYHVEYVHSKAQTRDGICVRQVGIIFSGGIAINLFVVNADNPLKPIDDDSRIQIVAAWKSEKTSLHGWQH